MIKNSNKIVSITLSKEDYNNLEALNKAFKHNGVKSSKSKILAKAFNEYLTNIVAVGAMKAKSKAGQKEDIKC